MPDVYQGMGWDGVLYACGPTSQVDAGCCGAFLWLRVQLLLFVLDSRSFRSFLNRSVILC
jgi:hypothetical protein